MPFSDSTRPNHFAIANLKDLDSFQKLSNQLLSKIHTLEIKHFKGDEHQSLEFSLPNLEELYLNNLLKLKVLKVKEASQLKRLNIGNLVTIEHFEALHTPKFNQIILGNKLPKGERFGVFTVEGEDYTNYVNVSNLNKGTGKVEPLVVNFRA